MVEFPQNDILTQLAEDILTRPGYVMLDESSPEGIQIVELPDLLAPRETAATRPYAIIPDGDGDAHNVGYENSIQRVRWIASQIETIKDTYHVEDPGSLCIRASDAANYIDDPAAYDGIAFSNEQGAMINLFGIVQDFSMLSSEFANSAAYNDVLLCDMDLTGNIEGVDTLGLYDNAAQMIAINLSGIWQIANLNIWDVTNLNDNNARPEYNTSSPPRTFMNEIVLVALEEFAHAHQNNNDQQWLLKGLPPNMPQDELFWHFGTEAQAKLSLALDVVEKVYTSYDTSLLKYLSSDTDEYGDMVRFLWEQTELHGREALSSPDVQFEAFTLFFKNEDTMRSYFDLEEIEQVTLPNPVPLPSEKFVEAFGKPIGQPDAPNFLEGRITDMSDIAAFIPDDFPVKIWIQSQFLKELQNLYPDWTLDSVPFGELGPLVPEPQ